MDDLTEKILHSDTVYRGSALNIRVDTVKLPDGRTGKREVVERPETVVIVPVTADGQILLVRQYKIAIDQTMLALPAGNVESGEDVAATAGRKLLAQTGYKPEALTRLVSLFSTPGICSEICHIFLASGLGKPQQKPAEDGVVAVAPVEWERALKMVWSGEIFDAASVAGILAADSYLKKS